MSGSSEQYIVNEKGQKTAVILDINEYEELLEDLHDIALVAERRDELTIDFEELKNRLKADGLL
ncbi:MAG TPA: type II toxin-antitoxin system Phd/YefM family antitoxin [Desulfobacteria bacterium]|nr:type II toxin-antitoxin system Phd/YefM family antitoxin [Desulfobacteria bacterium]